MVRVTFKVVEVNDLSRDGVDTRRIVLEANTANRDGTGLRHDGPHHDGQHPKDSRAFVDGKIDILVDAPTQAAFYGLGSLHVIEFASKSDASVPGSLEGQKNVRDGRAYQYDGRTGPVNTDPIR